MPASSLRRSTTLRGSSAANRAAVARRAASKKKATKMKRTQSLTTKRGAINATEAYKIAAAAALDLKEDKFFNVKVDGLVNLAESTVGNKVCSVLSFGTVDNQKINPAQPTGQQQRTYGGINMGSMNMLLPFDANATTPYLPYEPDGKTVKPNGGESHVNIQRAPVRYATEPGAGIPTFNKQTYRALPMRFRIIRVTPKQARGVVTDINPDTDLFQNQYGIEQGIGSADFSQIDMEFSKVNPEKYAVLQDTKFTLLASNVISSKVVELNNSNQLYEQDSPNSALQCQKLVSMKHRLTDKPGGDVRYQTETGWKPVQGLRREFVFIHAWYIGTGHQVLTNGADPPVLINAVNGMPANPNDVSLVWRFRSTFKDV